MFPTSKSTNFTYKEKLELGRKRKSKQRNKMKINWESKQNGVEIRVKRVIEIKKLLWNFARFARIFYVISKKWFWQNKKITSFCSLHSNFMLGFKRRFVSSVSTLVFFTTLLCWKLLLSELAKEIENYLHDFQISQQLETQHQ